MKRIYFAIISLLLLPLSMNAQIIKGDMDENGSLSLRDVPLLVNTLLGKTPQKTFTCADLVNNSTIAGLWYVNKTETVTFVADGTTNYEKESYFKFLPGLNYLVFCDADGTAKSIMNVTTIDAENLILDNKIHLTKHIPSTYVSSIKLSANTVQLYQGASLELTTEVLPADADNKSVIWKSSDEKVATVKGGKITAVSVGSATITCTAADGSGIKSECTVTVSAKSNPGTQVSDGSGA